ncbi:hypothetical protein OUZ56_021579 [Daphnia magna]|uniref:Ankyrin repeat domain-containing protein n=1 Tax=Daphnia magna TaxID=35525 RepID=A0ABR0AU37_9CRUS|nr:hypothetical protein OUZ56_021579 [Daphnia magna]
MPNLDLITEFEELHFNDFDYSLKSHQAHETIEMEQLNILNDLVSLMQESNSKSVSDIVMSEKQDNQIVKKTNEETLVMEQNSEDAVQHNEASDSESPPETNYIVIENYGADPDIEEDSQTIAHRAAAENNKLLIRILRYYKYKFSSYNSLGETPLMVAIAYGHEEVASYLWISSNVAQIAKDNSTVLHYAAKHGNNSLARAACERKIHININQTTRPGNYMALHLATMYRQDHIVNILLEHGAYPNITDVNGNNPQDYAFDEQRRNIFEDWDYIRGHKRKTSGSE